jgi:hypothetical protein
MTPLREVWDANIGRIKDYTWKSRQVYFGY